MAPPRDPPGPVAPLFTEERQRLLTLLRSLEPADWGRPTPCPGWSVLGLACHLVGDDLGVLARHRDGWFGTVPPDGVDEGGFIAWLDALQVDWVHAARRLSPRLAVELLAWTGPELAEHFDAQDASAIGAPVSWAGTGPHPAWLDQYRELSEYWIHRQQLLEALGREGDLDPRLAGAVLDALRWAYPYRLGTAAAAPGDGVTIALTGPVTTTWHLVRGDGGWTFTDTAPASPLAVMQVTTEQAWRLLTNNLPRAAQHTLHLRGRADVVEVLRGTRAIIGAPR